MLKALVYKEIQDSLVSARFALTLVLCTAMILLAVLAGAEGYRRSLDNYEATRSLNRQALEEQDNYYSLRSQGTKICKEPEVLQSLVSGVRDMAGNVTTVAQLGRVSLEESKSADRPLFAVFGKFDLTFVFSVLFSLLALLFSYNAVTGEKERGTLRLVLANRVPRPTVILGKFLGNLISLLLPMLIPLLLGMIVLANYPGIALASEHWLRTGLLVVLYLLYVTCFFSLGILSSTLVSRSSVSLLIVLLAWVAFIALIPRGAVLAANAIRPVPERSELTLRKEAAQREIKAEIDRLYNYEEIREERRDLYENPDPEPWREFIRQFHEERDTEQIRRVTEQFASIDEAYEAQQQAQLQLAANLARLSPTSTLLLGSMKLARTGLAEHNRFIQSVREYQPAFDTWAALGAIRGYDSKTHTPAKPDLASMPQHTFAGETLAGSVHRAVPDFLVLFLMNVLFFAGAYVSFLRYDVR